MAAGERNRLGQHLPAARESEPRRHGVAQPPALPAVPALAERLGLGERAVAVLDQARRRRLAGVHVALPRGEANAELRCGGEDGLLVVRGAHVHRGGGAAAQQLGDAEPRGGAHLLGQERRLVGPDALGQPAQQLEPLGAVAGQALNHVDVCLYEARKHQAVGDVEHGSARRRVEPGSDRGDGAPRHEDVAAERDTRGRHGDDASAAQQDGFDLSHHADSRRGCRECQHERACGRTQRPAAGARSRLFRGGRGGHRVAILAP